MWSRSVSAAGLDLIKTFEGFRSEPVALHEGGWVVGYSHVRVAEAGAAMSEPEAAELLKLDLAPFERFVSSKVVRDVSQSQFDALVSFCFSIGVAAFERSDVLRKVNAGQIVPAACAMDAWRKSSVGGESEVFDHLIRRRAAEKALFLKEPPAEGAPSVFIRAELDHAASILGAPIAYGEMPAIGAAPAPPKAAAPVAAAKIADVLKSEPATTLVLNHVVAADDEADAEITTANARPVARATAVQPKARFAFKLPKFETYALAALLAFGVALLVIGVSAMFGGGAQGFAGLAGLALATPGVAAAIFAVYGLWKGPAPRAVA